jgi:enoyl-CoA hydratase/carnithine racemase
MSRAVLTTDTVVATADGPIVRIEINRPAVRNAIDLPTARAIEAAVDAFEADDDLRVAVLHGRGSNFSAGMDLKAFAATGERPVTERRGALGMVAVPPTKPIIAVLHGATLGGGFELALACDLIVMEEGSEVGLPEVTRGLAAGGGGAIRLPQRIPHHVALDLVLTGRRMPAAEAERWGLATRVVPAGHGLQAGLDLAAAVAAAAPLGTRASKQIAVQSRTLTFDAALAAQEPLMRVVRTSDDAAEGARAFVERRPPRWTGR